MHTHRSVSPPAAASVVPAAAAMGVGDDCSVISDATSSCSESSPTKKKAYQPPQIASGVLHVGKGARQAFSRDPAFEAGLELMVQEIRDKVFNKTGLTCSAGCAPNPMLAKVWWCWCCDVACGSSCVPWVDDDDDAVWFVFCCPFRCVDWFRQIQT